MRERKSCIRTATPARSRTRDSKRRRLGSGLAARRAGSSGLLAIAVLVAGACSSGSTDREPPRLVLLYAPCTVSKRFLSPYDPTIRYTPHLERFARRALTFERHRTEAGSSGIAYAALFSGVQADRHGVFQHPARLPDELQTIGELYASHGYETYYWGGHPMASNALDYGQGVPAEHRFDRGLRAQDPRFRQLLAELKRDPTRRAFVMTSFTATHGPYSSRHLDGFLREHPEQAAGLARARLARFHELYRENYLALAYNFDATLERLRIGDALPEFARAVEVLYASNVAHLDRLFGEVLGAIEAVGLSGESLIAFTADHGEVMYRETAPFKWTHSSLLARDVIEVPWIVAWPGDPGVARRYAGVTRSVDVLPTLAGLSGIWENGAIEIEGRDLSEDLEAGRAPELIAYSHTSIIPERVFVRMQRKGGRGIWGERMQVYPRADPRLMWVAMQRGDWVFEWRNLDGSQWGLEAFDLAADPGETRNLFDASDPAHRAAAEALERYKARLVARAETDPARGPAPDREEESLRALGYIR